MPMRHAGRLASHASTLATRPLLAQYDRATLFVPYDVDVFLPISMPITAILLLGVWGSAMLLLSSVPCPVWLAGRAGARPDHPILGHLVLSAPHRQVLNDFLST